MDNGQQYKFLDAYTFCSYILFSVSCFLNINYVISLYRLAHYIIQVKDDSWLYLIQLSSDIYKV